MRIIILDKKIVPNEETIIEKKQVIIKRIQNREYTARFFVINVIMKSETN